MCVGARLYVRVMCVSVVWVILERRGETERRQKEREREIESLIFTSLVSFSFCFLFFVGRSFPVLVGGGIP